MNKLAKLIAEGKISVDELAGANDLIARAQLIKRGIRACRKNLAFPLGKKSINCYYYCSGDYEAWGICSSDGTFRCFSNWGGAHEIGKVSLKNYKEVFMAFENSEFEPDLRRFFLQQIEKEYFAK